jgi:DNA polymerase III delta subunit
MSGQIFAFLGSPALVRNEAKRIIEERAPGRDSLQFQRMYAEEAEKNLPEEILSFSMFSSSRVFWVQNLETASQSLLEFLLTYVTGVGLDSVNTLILTGAGLPKKGPVRKLKAALKKHGTVREYPIQKVDPMKYVQQLCSKFSVEISRKGRDLLLQRVGKDLLSMENEVAKLACFADGKPLTDRDVEELTATISEASIWDLTDALVLKDAGKAMETLHKMMEEGRAPHQILSTICWQVRQLLTLQESQQKKAPLPKSWIRIPERKRQNAIRILMRNPLEAHKIFSQLQRSNRLFNSSRAGDKRNLELLVLELCTD